MARNRGVLRANLREEQEELTDWGALGAVNLQKKIKKYRENLAVSKRAVFDVFSNKKLQKWSVLSCMDRYDVF